MASWKDRLKETIILTSPISETEFIAKWSGNAISNANKLAIHTAPGVRGARVQDLRAGPDFYELFISFSGEEHDIEAEDFAFTLKTEKGNWRIDHPTKGPIFLARINSKQNVFPVTNGNITRFETEWIEPNPEEETESLAQIQDEAKLSAFDALLAGFDSFLGVIKETQSEIQSVFITVGSALTSVKKRLSLVRNIDLTSEILAIEASIKNIISGDDFDPGELAGQCQQLVRIFGLGQTSSTDAIEMYNSYADDVLEDQPTEATTENQAKMSVKELFAGAALASAAEMALIGGIDTRSQLVTTAQNLNAMQDSITNKLDETGQVYANQFIDKRYYSQLETYRTSFASVQSSTRFLFASLLGIPTERRIIIRTEQFIAQVAKDEYGSIGDETSEIANIIKLQDTNALMGDELYLLPAGKEILIYQ